MAVTQKSYVDSDAAVKKARATLTKANAEYNAAKKAYDATPSNLGNLAKTNKAKLDAAKAALDKAKSEEGVAVTKAINYYQKNTEEIQAKAPKEATAEEKIAALKEARSRAAKANPSLVAGYDAQITALEKQATAAKAADEKKKKAAAVAKTKEENAPAKLRDYATEITTAGRAVDKMSNAERLALSTALKDAGYNVTPSGLYTDSLVAAYQQAIGDNQIRSTNRNQEVDFKSFLASKKQETALAGTGVNKGKTTTDIYPSRTSAEDAKAKINDVFQTRLGRDATDAELKAATSALWADEDANPSKQIITIDAKGNKTVKSSGGTNAAQFLNDYINKTATLKTEAEKYKVKSPTTITFESDKKIYNDAIAALGSNPTPEQIAKVKATTKYGQGLIEMENAIKSLARSATASNTPEELTKIAEDAYNQNFKIGSSALQEFVNGQLSFKGEPPATTIPTSTPTATTTPTSGARTPKISLVSTLGEDGVTDTTAATSTTTSATAPATTPAEPPVTIGGPGGQTLTNLKNIALKNGVNLDDPKYANQIADWVKDIKAGADPEKYYAQIRSIAGEGKNNWIRKQLAAGQNLKDIYATAINQVAGAFGLDAESIDLNDPIFSKIFTDKGVVDNKTLASILHSDPRWGGSTEQEKRDSEIKLNIQSLENAAKRNGIDLASVFPEGAEAIATSIVDKKINLAKIYQTIRDKASDGKSKYVQEQLKSGKDLRDIYASYINKMATAFEVDADTIDINDALLQQAFTDKGPTKLNDFQTLLEGDDRFKNTSGFITKTNTKEGALKQLKQFAKLNGFDLDAKYGSQVDQWINDIIKGKDINSIIQTIRTDAGAGKSKYVQEQLALGNDLRDIYSNYINQMASAFNIDANTIDVNDPLLANVFTDKGPITTLDFKNLMRNDARYKGTTGAIGESQVLQAVKDAAVQIGATISDADAADIAAQAASKGLGTNSPEIAALIRSKIAYKTGDKLTGAAGTALQDLRNTAMANGMDLDKMFGGQVQDWLQKIAQGESPETYKKLIRETAKVGLPDNVKKLMDQGVDLNTVYSPYKNMMGNILEINPDTIDINDPTLRAAIGPDKEMSLYDWQRALRKDPRWQYTNNAKAEVSNAVQGVLKDFGFIG